MHARSNRERAEERIQRQLEHLTALSAIDRVIASNIGLRLSLSKILDHVTTELGIDAADILVLNSSSQILEFGAGRGFRTKAAEKAEVRLGESRAGRAALDHIVEISSLKDQPGNLLLTQRLAGEDFVRYFGVPLIAKGQVKGGWRSSSAPDLNPTQNGSTSSRHSPASLRLQLIMRRCSTTSNALTPNSASRTRPR